MIDASEGASVNKKAPPRRKSDEDGDTLPVS